MSNIDKGIKVVNGLSLASAAPLDTKFTAETIEERNSYVTGNVAYKGMLVYVVETDTYYRCTGEAPNDADFSPCWKDLLGGIASDSTVVKVTGDQSIDGVKRLLKNQRLMKRQLLQRNMLMNKFLK